MPDTFKPRDEQDVVAVIQSAVAERKTLEIVGEGSKRGLGRAAQCDLTVDVSGLSGVTLYEPEELVLAARAGTPISAIAALIDGKGQQLAFEPIDYGPVLGYPAGRGTLGGALAANLSGPRRIKAGAARDHFLGVTAVSGRGELFKSGGRVVKNVTGYDLCKLLAGSWGTLAIMTEVTIKVLPRAEIEETLVLSGLDDNTAVRAMAAAMGSSVDVSSAAHFGSGFSASHLLGDAAGGGPATVLRLEGVRASIAHRRRSLEMALKPFGAASPIMHDASRALWQSIRDAKPFAADDLAERPLWRVSTAPTKGPQVAAQVTTACVDVQIIYDWAGGLVWLMLPPLPDAGAAAVRAAVHAAGGHAMLVRAPASLRASLDVFEPQDAPLAALTRRVKESFDPYRVLAPGRMYAGV
jgi:glycolate oxidase FAD binding subunit